ncbi:uL15 family ribosomal protein [Candidatus Woesearchaeota archaeon]|nr:uL15 family ribosomal protein [Candidatus Woesearchaeota archaeon]
MTVNRRKKDTRQRGSHTHGWGSKKKHRGSGNRGGKGMAGTGKRADSKKPSIWQDDYFGKHGFASRGKRLSTVNVGFLDESVEKLVKASLAKHQNGSYEIDLSEIGFDKLLGRGQVRKKLIIKADSASKEAVDAVKAAGGEVLLPGQKS